MTRPVTLLLALCLGACVNLYNCRGDGDAGDSCETGEDCSSGVCLNGIRCVEGAEPLSICASGRCTDRCPDGETCVRPFGLSRRYCYPLWVCEPDDDGGDGGDGGEQLGDGSAYDG